MASDREREIERICEAALELLPAERAAFLSTACGDDQALRREVESLLVHEVDASAFLATPALEVVARSVDSPDSALTPGQRLGHYTVLSRLGVGGMGEVYRARDQALGREVAIKVLPSPFTTDADRLARFEREARVLAALNHPNIATIHGVERIDSGESAGGPAVHALVLELVEGETLSDVIGRRPIPVDRALTIARQIAGALEAAHEKGVVHRDLKPANIKIRPDGVVKVLDFGLAKLVVPPGASAAHDTATVTSETPALSESRTGMVLGTAAYMSPEQARGQPVDKRADVWAFGCVLFEMLTGQPVFASHTVTDTMANVVSAEPQWALLPVDLPVNVRRLMKRCLRKEAAQRLHDIADARIELDEAPEAADSIAPSPWRSWVMVAIALAMGGGLGALLLRRPMAPPAEEVRLEINTPPTLDPISVAISPDGRSVVFAAVQDGRSQLWVRRLNEGSSRPLPRTDNASRPFWSPDGRSIGFSSGMRLMRVDLESDAVRTVAPLPNVMQGGSWGEDGTILFNRGTGSSLWRVPADGGEPSLVTQLDSLNRFHRSPQFLPGRRFLFRVVGPKTGIYVGELDSAQSPRRILDADEAVYVRTGHLFFVRDHTLLAQAFDLDSLRLSGSPVAIAENVIVGEEGAALSASVAGPVVFRTGAVSARTTFMWFDRSGRALGPVAGSEGGSSFRSALSPDERQLAFTRRATESEPADIWLVDIGRGVPNRMTTGAGFELSPEWSPDGRRIAFRREGESVAVVVRDVGRTVNADTIVFSDASTGGNGPGWRACWPDDWSPDGRFLLCAGTSQDTRQDVWAISVDPGNAPRPIAATPFEEGSGQFSPDGRWVAYQSDDSGSQEIYVSSFSDPGRRAPVSAGGGVQARWKPDGTEIYYLAPDNRLMSVSVGAGATPDELRFGSPQALFQTQVTGNVVNGRHYHVTKDGRFLVDTLQEVVSPITVLLNWQPPARASRR